VLHAVEDGELLRPRDAVFLEGAAADAPDVLSALAPLLAGLVAAPRGGRSALTALGVRRLALADLVELLPESAPPEAWRQRYAALSGLADDAASREALAALPVPLADGRTVRGTRGLLQLEGRPAPEGLAALGLRVVHPDAAHPLLLRLGAVPATSRSLLEAPATRAAVEAGPDVDDPDEVADAVLSLAAAAVEEGTLRSGDLPWLGLLALRDADGELAPASALALAGSLAAELLDPDEIGRPSDDLLDRWPADALTAVGVLDGLGVIAASDVDLDAPPPELTELDGFERWAEEASGADGATAGELLALRDLDVVRESGWPRLLAHVGDDPALRRAVVEPVRVVDRRGRPRDVPSYTSWWLRSRLGLEGTVVAGSGVLGGLLDGLLDPAPEWVRDLDPAVRRALGVLDDVSAGPLGPAVAATLLDRTADPGRPVDVRTCLLLWRELAALGPDALEPPDRLRVLDGERTAVVDADRAVVADDPRWV
jgi:hypothetical protein